MQKARHLWLAGNDKKELAMFATALKSELINVSCFELKALPLKREFPDVVVLFMGAGSRPYAQKWLSMPELAGAFSILAIHAKDRESRIFAATAQIDDIILKPIRFKEAVLRIELILNRSALPGEFMANTLSELSESLKNLENIRCSGTLRLFGSSGEGAFYFDQGKIVGIAVGHKIQKDAADAFWRLLPCACEITPDAALPEFIRQRPFFTHADDVVLLNRDARVRFQELLATRGGMDRIFRIHGSRYERAQKSLPLQVRHVLLHFDGTRTVGDILDQLEICDTLLYRVIAKLMDDGLIVAATQIPAIPPDERIEKKSGNRPVSRVHFGVFQKKCQTVPLQSEFKDEKRAPEILDTGGQNFNNFIHMQSGAFDFATQRHSRRDVERRMSQAHEPLVTSCTQMRRNRQYASAFLEEERARDEAQDALLEITVEASPLDAGQEGAEDAIAEQVISDTRNDLKTGPPAKRGQSMELTPEAWKSQTLQRLSEQNLARDKKRRRHLLIGIAVLSVGLVVILAAKYSAAPKPSSIMEASGSNITASRAFQPAKHPLKEAEQAPAEQARTAEMARLPVESERLIKPEQARKTARAGVQAFETAQTNESEPKANGGARHTAPRESAPKAKGGAAVREKESARHESVEKAAPMQTDMPDGAQKATLIAQVKDGVRTRRFEAVRTQVKQLETSFSGDMQAVMAISDYHAKRGDFKSACHWYGTLSDESRYQAREKYWAQLARYCGAAGDVQKKDEALLNAIRIAGGRETPAGQTYFNKLSHPADL